MKILQAACRAIAAVTLALLTVSCATEFQNRKDLAIAAGFKIITPVKPDQVALLPTLPKDQITPITYDNKSYFVLPDVANNQAYVGGPDQYQAYQKLRLAKKISDDQLAAAHMNQMNSMNQMNWGMWGGWSGVSPYGMPRAGVYRR